MIVNGRYEQLPPSVIVNIDLFAAQTWQNIKQSIFYIRINSSYLLDRKFLFVSYIYKLGVNWFQVICNNTYVWLVCCDHFLNYKKLLSLDDHE